MGEPSLAPRQQEMEALARAAGLARAWAEHRAEVEEAIAAVARLRAGFARPGDPAAEPSPPYRPPPPGGAATGPAPGAGR